MNILNYNIKFLSWLTYMIPISLVSGSFLLNLNLILIVFFYHSIFFLSKKSFEYIKLEWFKVAFLFLFIKFYHQ